MKIRHQLRTVAALAMLPALLAPPASVSAQSMINLREADIRAFIDDVSKVTGTSFVIDPRVQGKVSVVSDRPLSRTAYFELFLATLRANGYVAVPMGQGQYRVQPAEAGAGSGTREGSRFATAVIRLTNIDAQSAVESLRPLLSRNGTAAANRAGNAVIVADFADNIARARAALNEIDRDRTSSVVVPLANAGARDLAQSLAQLMRAGSGPDARPGVSVVAVDGSNAIALRGEPDQVAKVAAMARDLDRRAIDGSEIRVIFMRHADAAAIMPVLQQLMGQQPTATGSAAAAPQLAGTPFGGSSSGQQQGQSAGGAAPATASLGVAAGPQGKKAIIARYEGANAIIISASTDIQRQLGEVIRQLDTQRAQIQVEAIIVEISDSAAQQLGVQWLLADPDGSRPFLSTNFSNAAPNLLAIAGAVAGSQGIIPPSAGLAFQDAAIKSLLGTIGGTAGFGGRIFSNTLFGFVINAVKNDGDSNVLSTPSIMTLDNQAARILVGQEIPVTTGEALGANLDNSFRTVQRQDVGIQLSVKPQINAGGSVTLTIKQVVSSIAATIDVREFVLNKREIETAVTVGDGQILALGGLLDDNERKTLQKVPLLGDIPGIGQLFRSRTKSRTKTNLMVFIRPTIVRDRTQGDALTAARWDTAREAQTRRDGFSSLDALAYDYLRTLPPYKPYPFPPPPLAPPVTVPIPPTP